MTLLRVCNKCGKKAYNEGDLELFKKASKSTYGRDNICKVCDSKRSRAYRTPEEHRKWEKKGRDKNKDKALKYLGGACYRCGVSYTEHNACIFDFHHRDPNEKEHSPACIMRWSWNKIKKEIDKCDLLCSNCHRLVHSEGKVCQG